MDHAELATDVERLRRLLYEAAGECRGPALLDLIEGLERAALATRASGRPEDREAFAARFRELGLDALDDVARTFTLLFHLFNAAEEQHRIRVLRRRDRPQSPPDGSIASAFAELRRQGVPTGDVRELLARLFIMPVLTAHPTEARRQTVLEHLSDVAAALNALEDARLGASERARELASLRRSIETLLVTDETRPRRPVPLDEVRAGLHVFEWTLFDVTSLVYRELEDALAATWPGERFAVGPFLRFGTWIGGDRDGNPHVTAEVTRAAFERQRALVLNRYRQDAVRLGRELSASTRRLRGGAPPELLAGVPPGPGSSTEPWRARLSWVQARLAATLRREDAGYPDCAAYLADLTTLEDALSSACLRDLARGRLRDARRRAEVFGFHLASLDLRQHSAVHEQAVAELLERGGVPGYLTWPEERRARKLAELLDRLDGVPLAPSGGLSPVAAEIMATLAVVGRARRDNGAEACERWVISFSKAPSDVLEALFLARAAGLAPAELRPVPLYETLADIEQAEATTRALLALGPYRVALRGELEIMIGYSDSGKDAGYVPSNAALLSAQKALARLADEQRLTLTIFHGRGGAVGRGGGPANRSIRAQPREALRGRLRMTEQGETIAARYGRREIAKRDLEQMIHAVILGSLPARAAPSEDERGRAATLRRGAGAALATYRRFMAEPDRVVAYVLSATPLREIAELPIASRPASRSAGGVSLADLRAIPWVFSWNQSRHGLPGWFGLGSALDAIAAAEGPARAAALYAEWPSFRALIDNAQLALARADLDVAERYARLAPEHARGLFAEIREEHRRTLARVLETTGAPALLAEWPTLAQTVARRNPYVDVLSYAQIELLRRLDGPDSDRVREVLFVTISGIAAGLQTAG